MPNSNNYNEMLIHIPLCSHKDPQNVLIFSDDASGIKTETARHHDMNFTVVSADKAQTMIRDAADASFDLVIFDTLITPDTVFLAHLNRATTEQGMIVAKASDFMNHLEENRALMDALGAYFKIVMPYSFDADQTGSTKETLLLASKFYHPTADVILHRTDLIDGLSYYNCDVHPACFVQPNYLRTALKGVARN